MSRLWLLLYAAALAAGVAIASRLWQMSVHLDLPPLWDMARNGWNSYQLVLHLAVFDLTGALHHILAQITRPPGYMLLGAPFAAIGGGTFAASILPQIIAYALVPLGMVLLARQVDAGAIGLAAGIVAVVLWFSSPIAGELSLLVLHELPGTLLTLIAVLAYLRARRRQSLAAWRLAALCALAVFMFKYQYGLAWLITVCINEALDVEPAHRVSKARALASRLPPWRHGSLAGNATASLVWLTVLLAVVGVDIGGWPWMLLVLSMIGAVAARFRTSRASGRRPATRAAVEMLFLPLSVWLLLPDPHRLHSVLRYLGNRSSELDGVGHLLFYPKAFVSVYFTPYELGILVSVLAAAGAVAGLRRRNEAWRIVALFSAVMVLLCTLHDNKVDRLLFTATPAICLLAGTAAVFAAAKLLPDARNAGIAAAALAIVVLAIVPALSFPKVHHWAIRSALNKSGAPVMLDAARQAAAWSGDSEGKVAVFGTFNQLSPSVLRWVAYRHRSLETEILEPRSGGNEGIETWLDRENVDTVLVLELARTSRLRGYDYETFNQWKVDAAAPVLVSERWLLVDSITYPRPKLTIKRLRRAQKGTGSFKRNGDGSLEPSWHVRHGTPPIRDP